MRADIDALPIKEDPVNMAKERVCISENEGIMHACGHDGHMAMLLTEAKILAQHKDEWEGKIVFMFEEAEEMGERGIAPLLRYLRDNKIHIDTCFGTHVMWNLPAGKVGILYGSALAGAYFFRVKLQGRAATDPVRTWHKARSNASFPLRANFVPTACVPSIRPTA